MLKELFEIAAVILAGAAVVAIVVAIVTWDEIKSWFQSHKDGIDNTNTVARTMIDSLANGNYKVRHGVFNKQTAAFQAEKTVECKDIDAELKRRHAGKRIVDHYIS
jgi:phage-related protein